MSDESPRARVESTHPTDTVKRVGRRGWRPALAASAIALIAIALIATAMLFAIATGTTDTADQGEVGILSEASLSAAAAVRNGIVQAQVLAEAKDLGIATSDEVDRALRRIDAASAELAGRVDRLAATAEDSARFDPILVQTDELVSQAAAAAAYISSGDLAESATLITEEVEGTYSLLAGLLAAQRDASMARIALAGEDAGRIADAARFLVVLLVPMTVLLAYRKRLRNEQTQRDLEHRLEKQQAVGQAQDEFIANLSHELRTPLTAIYGFSLELIEPGRIADPELERELATYIASESADLSRMVEDILTAASADQDGLSISIDTVDPVAEIDSVLGALRATGARIESDLTAARITTDPLRFRQVIRNLVSNALRHGGPNNLVAGRIEGELYTIQVRDDGPGIPDSLKDRLFTRFIHQGNEPLLTGSVGLGLAIAQLLTTSTGGTISYRRDRGETVFSVTFPMASSYDMPNPKPLAGSDPVSNPRPLASSDSASDPKPYVYQPGWRDRDPSDRSARQGPASRSPKPDLTTSHRLPRLELTSSVDRSPAAPVQSAVPFGTATTH
jgi:signal transduction histidine kinase